MSHAWPTEGVSVNFSVKKKNIGSETTQRVSICMPGTTTKYQNGQNSNVLPEAVSDAVEVLK
jgi:hypothetical protein